MGGLTGIDWPAAETLHGDSESWPAVKAALRFYEAGALAGAAKAAQRRKESGDG